MSQWIERILSRFTADLDRLWVACDPDDVLLDEKLLAELRSRGFELMLYEDPFVFRTEFEERYRVAWDRGESGPTPSLVVHWRGSDASELPWDIGHYGRVVSLSLAQRNRSLSGVLLQPPSAQNNPSHIHQGGAGSDQGDSDQQQVAAA